MDASREKRVELILQQLEELPTLSAVAMRVLETTSDENSSASDIVALICSDQSLSARVLQLARQGGSGISKDVESVERAIVLLGFDAIRCMVLGVSVFQTFASTGTAGGVAGQARFRREEFWKHAVAVSCMAELLAERLPEAMRGEIPPSTAMVCGLLHDLGKVALDAALPKSFDRVVEASDLLRGNIADLERNIIGLDHMVVGKRLAERWNLPVSMRECIWLHGQLPSSLPGSVKNPALVNLITLADVLVRDQHLGFSGNYTFPIPRAILYEAVGIGAAHVEEALHELVTRLEPRIAVLGLGQTSSADLFLGALTQANRELSRVSTQLLARNKRLAVRSQFFDALSQFHGELRVDSGCDQVLDAIGQTAAGVLGVSSLAVFSAIPGKAFAQTMLFDSNGEVFESMIVDCPVRIGRPDAGVGPVLPVGEELEWLQAAISPRLAADKRYCVRLEADDRCIGGIVWGAKTGEGERLASQAQELSALCAGWALALRTAQIREESRTLVEQLAEANRRLNDAQDHIQRSKTIVTVGEMAAGAAHEMNNPLAVISGRSQLLASQLTDPKQRHAAHLIFEQSHALSEIISELMDFAKPVPAAPEETDLVEVIQRSLHEAKFATDPVDRTIGVTIGDIPLVLIDVKQVTAALIEVISNAIQATNEKTGTISIQAAHDPSSASEAGRVALIVTDNGSGMDEETSRRAFDPFFSSKPAGRRRGMGLAKALRWIEASGGSIRLESQAGIGTRSIILLPAAQVITAKGADMTLDGGMERRAL